jgi:hypothetical protein
MCQGITDQWCVLPACTGKALPPEFTQTAKNPELVAQRQAANIKAGKGYWSTESIRKRQGFYPVKRLFGVSFPEGRHSLKEQQINRMMATHEIAEFAQKIANDDSVPQREKESIMFSAGLAHDYAIFTGSSSATLELPKDDVPLMKRVNNA